MSGDVRTAEGRFRKRPVVIDAYQTPERVEIPTLEGTMVAEPGDWIITGVKGERYPCKPDIFAATYEPAGAPGEQARHEGAGAPDVRTAEGRAALRALDAEATPGPWRWSGEWFYGAPSTSIVVGTTHAGTVSASEPDAALVAASRNALAPLLDYVEELEAWAQRTELLDRAEAAERRVAELEKEVEEAWIAEASARQTLDDRLHDRVKAAEDRATRAEARAEAAEARVAELEASRCTYCAGSRTHFVGLEKALAVATEALAACVQGSDARALRARDALAEIARLRGEGAG